MSKIILTKTTGTIFLAIVLIAGTIVLSAPSFMIDSAQAQPYYGMDSYDDRKLYDKKPYGNDNSYESQYQSSYKPDYKPKYPSYVKDDRDKSKDSKSVSINKIKCINDNININGNNAGNVNIGNKGTDKGYLGTYSSDGSGGYDGHNKKDKDFTCIINNNNTNTNIGGNVTDTCEECFKRFLIPTELTALDELLIGTLETYCNLIGAGDVEEDDLRATLVMVIGQGQEDRIDSIIDCLLEIGVVFAPPT